MRGGGGASRVPLDRGVRTRARGDARARACGAEPGGRRVVAPTRRNV